MTVYPIPQQSDEITEDLVVAAKSGDHAAIGSLASSAFRVSVTFYRYTGVPVDHAEDLAADAVESVVTNLPNLRSASKYESWMWSIIRNRLRDHWRRRKTLHAVEPQTPAPLGPEEVAVIHEEHAVIRTALGRLSLRDRELLWLREVLDLDYATIAERVGTSSVAARVACHRARTRLQNAYEHAEEDGVHALVSSRPPEEM